MIRALDRWIARAALALALYGAGTLALILIEAATR